MRTRHGRDVDVLTGIRSARRHLGLLFSALAVGVFTLLLAAGSTAQSPETPTFRSASSELVVLPVTVTDRSGHVVANLPQSAFDVRDNGVRQPLSLFTNEDSPVSVGLVVDSSRSMGTKLGEVVAATVAFARSSNPEDELFVLAFNDAVHETVAGRRFLLASDVKELEHTVLSLIPEGRTALYDAIIAGLDRLDRGSRARKVLIVISDGGDNASEATLERALARARESDAEIYTIGLFDPDDHDKNPNVLASFASATGGERFLPRSAGPLLQACERIARDIRSGYTLAYEPPAHDGSYRRVQVTIDAPDHGRVVVRTRPGYTATRRTTTP